MSGAYDFIVVGGGPGGYPGALYLAKRGLRVALVEAGYVGGECTNYGCIPTKALLATVKPSLKAVLEGREAGRLDVRRAFDRAREVAGEVREGLRGLLDSSGVVVIEGEARLSFSGSVVVESTQLESRRGVLLASGSEPLMPESWRVSERVVSNRGILEADALLDEAETIVVVGGGAVGVEFSQILAGLGYRVHLVEALPRLLPTMEKDLGLVVRRLLSRLGVVLHLGMPVTSMEDRGSRVAVGLDSGEVIDADLVLIAVGRRPRSQEALRVGARVDEKNFVIADGCGRSNLGWLYAAGDVRGPPLLAHKAMIESKSVAKCIAEGRLGSEIPIPQVVYGVIDVVSVGLSLEEAASLGYKAIEARIGTAWNAANRIWNVREGMVKIVYDGETKKILGVHMAFPGASEAAGEASLLVSRGLTVEDLASSLHPHPTGVEVLVEAAEAILGEAVHVRQARTRHARR